MKRIKVKTLWRGQIGVRDKLVDEARGKGEGITFLHNNETMQIKADDIPVKIVGRSEKPFNDRFSRDKHYLIYFDWCPDAAQERLC